MTFLKKLGEILAKGVAVAPVVGRIVRPFLGSAAGLEQTVENDLVAIGGVVVAGEAFLQEQGSGADRLRKSTPLVSNIVRTSELVAGKKIANEALFLQGCGKITDGTADVLNSLDASGAKTA